VHKAGFQDTPEKRISLHQGEQARLAFVLNRIQHPASLWIQNGTPGSAVLIDDSPVGVVQADGTFRISMLDPGDHAVELRKEQFAPKKLNKHFTDGATVTLSGSDSQLQRAMSQIRVIFSPADAMVTLASSEGNPTVITSGSFLSLPPGPYELTTHIGSYLRSVPLVLAAGESRTIGPLALAVVGMQNFEDPSGWKANNGWLVHRGGGFLLVKTTPLSGTLVFSAVLEKGHRLQWVFGYSDDKNYELFQMDENDFYRSVVRNGETTEAAKIPFKTGKKKPQTFQIVITPNRILHQIAQGSAWVNLDSWSQPGNDLTSGSFGFFIPGSDEVGLSNFAYYPDLKLR